MRNKLSIFNKSRLYDRVSAESLGIFLMIILFIPEFNKLVLLAICYLYICFFTILNNFLPALRNRFVSVEKVYEGEFDQLAKEMYEAGLELQSKMGKRYIFGTKYILLKDEDYLVEDQGSICMVRSSKGCMYFLEKHLSLREKQGI